LRSFLKLEQAQKEVPLTDEKILDLIGKKGERQLS